MDTAGEQHAAQATHLKGVILVLVAGTFWSISGIVVRLIEQAQPWQIVFYRSLTSMLTLTVWIAYQHRGQMGAAFRAAGGRAVTAGLCLSLAFTCWVFALTQTTVANAMFLLTTKPFIAAILGRLILRERVAP
uniref:DMT family transporter n=1 Tax=Candidatus Entotheonella palauensis TaxID=93172 RepID=UPI001177EEDA